MHLSVPLTYYLFIFPGVMPSHLTVIKIYDCEGAWLGWRAASESLRDEEGTALASQGATKAEYSSRCWGDYSIITNHLPVRINCLWWH